MIRDEIIPYEGDRPYLFVSYCHRDENTILPLLRFFQDEGIRLWYDIGIDPGTEWPEVIANHLDQSGVFLAFISQEYLESHNCRKEFNFAMMKNMPSLSVILEPVQFTPVMKLQMASVQAICQYQYGEQEFRDKLMKMPALSMCRSARPKTAAAKKRFYLKYIPTSRRVLISHSGFKIGRRTDLCDFAVEDNKTVSKVHAVFDITDGVLSVRDDSSLNRTYINDAELPRDESRSLRAGDLVEMGSAQFLVEIEDIGGAWPRS